MRRSPVIIILATTTALVTIWTGRAQARLDLYVDKSTQQISVIRNGSLLYVWPVSTGSDRHSTPNGIYMAERLERNWVSQAYSNSPMPYAIFFHNGYAIHGSYDIDQLGGPASHGCVRLHPNNAALLFSMVEQEGPGNTTIVVRGDVGRTPSPYREFDGPPPPPLRRDDGAARGPYPPPRPMPPPRGIPDRYEDRAYSPRDASPYYRGPYAERPEAYPPPPDMRPYDDPGRYADGRREPRDPSRYVDGRRTPHASRPSPDYAVDPYGGGRDAPRDPRVPPDYAGDPHGDRNVAPRSRRMPPPDYPPDRYADDRGGPHDPGIQPDDTVDSYRDGRRTPHNPRVQPDHSTGHYADRRGGPPASRTPPDYAVDPYGDGRMTPPPHGSPHSQGPSGVATPYLPPDRYGDGWSGRPRGPGTSPHYTADRYLDAPGGRRVDPPPATQGNHPTTRLPPTRRDATATRNGPRPGGVPGAKAKPGRVESDLPERYGPATGATANALPPFLAPSPPPPSPAATAALPPPTPAGPPASQEAPPDWPQYRVLPPSYWAGASWRWRAKRDDDTPQNPQ